MTLSRASAPVLSAAAASLALTGCSTGFSNMGQGLRGNFSIFGLIILVLDVIAIWNVWQSNRDTTSKVIWTLVIFFLPLVGLLLWYLVGRGRG